MRKVRGTSFIELLIAMVVMSLGMLGAASFLSNAMRNSQSSDYRTHAVWLASDIIDRMRANRGTAVIPNNADVSPYEVAFGDDPAGNVVVNNDIDEWRTELGQSLPDGQGSIEFENNVVTVTVQWNDSRVLEGNAQQELVLETRL